MGQCKRIVLAVMISGVSVGPMAVADDFDWETGSNNDNGGVWSDPTEWAGPLGGFPELVSDTATIADVGDGLSSIRLDGDYTIGELRLSDVSDFKPIWFGDFGSGTGYTLDVNQTAADTTTFSVFDSDVILSGQSAAGALRFADGQITAAVETDPGGSFHFLSRVTLTNEMQLIGAGDLEVSLDSILRVTGDSVVQAESITVGAETYSDFSQTFPTQQPPATIELLSSTDAVKDLRTDRLDLEFGNLDVKGGSDASLGTVTLGKAGGGLFTSALDGDITVDGSSSSAGFESIDLISGDITITNDGVLSQPTSPSSASFLGADPSDEGGNVDISSGGTLRLSQDMTLGGEAEVPLTINDGALTAWSSVDVFLSLNSGNDAPVTHTVTNGGLIANVRLSVAGNSLSGSDQTVLNVDGGSELDLRSLFVTENGLVDIAGSSSSLTTNDDASSNFIGRFGDLEVFVDGDFGNLLIRDGASFTLQDVAVFRDAVLEVRNGASGSADTLIVDQGGEVDIAGTGTTFTLSDTLLVDSNGTDGLFVQDAPSTMTIRDEAQLLGLSDLQMFDDAIVRFLSGAKGAFDDALLNGGVLDVFGSNTRVNVSGTNTLHVGYTDGGNANQDVDMVVNVEDGAELNSVNLVVGDTDGNGRLFGRTGAQITTDALEIGAALNSGNAAVQLQDENTLLTVNGDATVGGSGLLNVLGGAVADINGELTLSNGGDAQVLGGTLEVDAIRYTTVNTSRDLQYGTVRFTQDTLLDTLTLNGLLGSTRTLGPVQTLDVQGEATLGAPLELLGGTFAVDTLANADFLTLDTGTFRYRGDGQWQVFEIDYDGPLGAVVEVMPGLTIQGEARTISGDGFSSSVGPRVEDDGLVRIHSGGTFQAVDQDGETSGVIDNDGEIELLGPTARLLADRIDNAGLVHGTGRVDGRVENRPSGRIEANDGERLVFTGFSFDNNGTVAIDGGVMEMQELVNGPQNSGAQVIITNGTLALTDDFDEITNNARISGTNAEIRTFLNRDNVNNGTMAFTGDDNRLYGNWQNNAGALINVGGDGKVTFFNGVTQNGQVIVSASSLAVFLGDVTGSGSFTGQVEFAGVVAPGNSPGAMSFDNARFTETARIIMELAGLTPENYDRIDVAGLLEAGGVLEIDLLDGFDPSAGDVFDLFDFAALAGQFDLELPALQPGLSWDDSGLSTTGVIAVIPEPASATLLGLTALALIRRRGRS